MACWSNGKGKFCSSVTFLLRKGFKSNWQLVSGRWVTFEMLSCQKRDTRCVFLVARYRTSDFVQFSPRTVQPAPRNA